MTAIYKRELKTYFCGMTGAIFTAFLLLMAGIYTTAYNLTVTYPNFEIVISSIVIIFLLIIPIITMRSFSEEMHSRTDQLLYSLPMKLSSVVLAKYFALLTVLAVPVGIMCLYPLLLSFFGTVNFASAYGAILGFFLLGAALIAIGMFLSSLTESQVIAAVLTFGMFILVYLITSLTSLIPTTASASLFAFVLAAVAVGLILYLLTKNPVISASVGGVLVLATLLVYLAKASLFEGAFQKVLAAIALFDRITPFVDGLFDITSIVYFLSVSALFVFFTVQSMEKKRWA